MQFAAHPAPGVLGLKDEPAAGRAWKNPVNPLPGVLKK